MHILNEVHNMRRMEYITSHEKNKNTQATKTWQVDKK